METGGATPAGSGRITLRLDPFALPVAFPAHDAGADGEVRQVEIDRERLNHWIKKGARPSDTVRTLIARHLTKDRSAAKAAAAATPGP